MSCKKLLLNKKILINHFRKSLHSQNRTYNLNIKRVLNYELNIYNIIDII